MTKPVSKVVSVMPSWQLDSCVDRDLRHFKKGCGGVVAVVHGPLHAGLVKRYQGKLDSHEEAGPQDQGKTGQEENPFHLPHPPRSADLNTVSALAG